VITLACNLNCKSGARPDPALATQQGKVFEVDIRRGRFLAPGSVLAAGLIVVGGILVSPGAAVALEPDDVMADGIPLAGTTQADGEFVLGVAAPAGVKVKFKIDGSYLGQDSEPPYEWPVSSSPGAHEVDVRWGSGGDRVEVEVPFTVSDSGAPAPSESGGEPPAPAAPAEPAATANVISVSTAKQLIAALKIALPGQTIALADGVYTGKFIATVSGTAEQRITLTGSRGAVLTTGSNASGNALRLTGSYWNITGLAVSGAAKGIVLDGANHTVIDGVDVGNTGEEAVHLRTSSADVTVRNSSIHDTGLVTPAYGEGIYIGSAVSNWVVGLPDRSDGAQIIGNTISNTTGEGIDIKEGTTGGLISGNIFTNAGYSGVNFADSWVDVKGNGYQITGNSGSGALLDAFQVHVTLDGWGAGNVFRNNSVSDVSGYEVWVEFGATGTVVGCEPSAAVKGLTNTICTP
jgi:hypothetical protein